MLSVRTSKKWSNTVTRRRYKSVLHNAGPHVVPKQLLTVVDHKLNTMPKDSHGHLYPGHISPPRTVPASITRPEYVGKPEPAPFVGSDVKSPEIIDRIRYAGSIAALAIEHVGANAIPGTTTDELDSIGHEFLIERGAYPSTLGYRGFPKSVCTSINEVICHGIPDDTVLEEGDIVNIDITAFIDNVHGDCSQTFVVGTASDEATKLVDRTREALRRGITAVAPGRRMPVIGRAIESYARRFAYGVVRDFTGHGVGESFHSGLVVPHFDSTPHFNAEIEVGMVFTIEPMLTLGTAEWDMWPDGWTIVTRDKSLTAQFEHTILVTEGSADLLTRPTR